MTALVVSPAAILADIERRAGLPLLKHGTRAAFAQHRLAGEEPCCLCADAERTYQRGRGLRGGRTYRPCGTHAAYTRHRARGETPCDDCFTAERAYDRERKRNRRRSSTARSTAVHDATVAAHYREAS